MIRRGRQRDMPQGITYVVIVISEKRRISVRQNPSSWGHPLTEGGGGSLIGRLFVQNVKEGLSAAVGHLVSVAVATLQVITVVLSGVVRGVQEEAVSHHLYQEQGSLVGRHGATLISVTQ